MKNILHSAVLLMSLVALTACQTPKKAYQKGMDDGYAQSSSDNTKRRYWQDRNKSKAGEATTVYYVVDESGTTDAAGQVKPAGTKVAIPVTEPQPVR